MTNTPSFIYQALVGSEITEPLLNSCAELFSTNYGFWGETPLTSKYMQRGEPVKMNGKRLRAQCVAIPEKTVLVTCFSHNRLLGHAFATVWDYEGGVVGWITQLVVDKSMRRRYIATHLLQTFKLHPLFHNITAVGLVSSHPAACNALAKYAGIRVDAIDLVFIQNHAKNIFQHTTVGYLKGAQFRGSLFQDDTVPGVISSVDTEFFVDHHEPLAALEKFKDADRWCLGELLDGHEYLIVVPVESNLNSLQLI